MTLHHATLTPQTLARALGGDVAGAGVTAPGPGHSADDRSMSVRIVPGHPDGFIVKSHSTKHSDLECKDYIREKLGLPPWQPKAKREGGGGRQVAEYIYRQADETPYLKVVRLKDPKSFPQYHWNGSGWAKGKPKGPKIPYRLPELLRNPHAPVLIVEGEKDADNLARLGLLGTSASEGAGKWTPDLGKWFKGRIVNVLADNDDAGRKHARQVAESLHGIAAEVRIVELPGLAEAGDVSDWIAADGDVEELLRLCETAPLWSPDTPEAEQAGRTSRFFSAAELKGKPVPERDWLARDFVPMNTVTLFGGDGGSGKSLLGHQMAVSAVALCAWLGMSVKQGRVIYLSAEDDEDELHRRLDDILRLNGLSYDDVAGLTMRSLAGEDALLAVESGLTLMASELFKELEQRAEEEAPVLILLDTAADMYPANENDRAKVRQFIGLLRGLAIRLKCAVVLLSHPSLTGLGSGSGTSGSTAWNNSVRSRLYLERVIQDGYEPDPDKRRLTVKKANYGRVGTEIGMTWRDGVFVADVAPTGLDHMAANAKAERVFLKLLDEMAMQGRFVSAQPGPTYAPSKFAKHPEAEGVTARAFAPAMEALLQRRVIVVGEHGRGQKARSHLQRAGATPGTTAGAT